MRHNKADAVPNEFRPFSINSQKNIAVLARLSDCQIAFSTTTQIPSLIESR